jgi:hypothetical protein
MKAYLEGRIDMKAPVFYIARKKGTREESSITVHNTPFNEQRSIAVYQNILTSLPPNPSYGKDVYRDQKMWYQKYITKISGGWLCYDQNKYWCNYLRSMDLTPYDDLRMCGLSRNHVLVEPGIPPQRHFVGLDDCNDQDETEGGNNGLCDQEVKNDEEENQKE